MESLHLGQLLVTFLAGILSILSPCILPILPGFLAYFTGLSLDEAKKTHHRSKLLLNGLAFSAGFTLTFLSFGLAISSLSLFLIQNQLLLIRLGGLLLILFGIIQTGLLKLSWLQKEFKIDAQKLNLENHLYWRSFIIGVIFAFGWTPCYGPIIGGIFTLGATTSTLGQSLLLFLVYSLGFTLPIIIMSLALDQLSHFFSKHRQIFQYAHLLAGILLIIMGVLMLTNSLGSIVNWLDFIYTQNKLTFF